MILLLKQSSCLELDHLLPHGLDILEKKILYSYFLLLYDGGDLLELGTGELCIKT